MTCVFGLKSWLGILTWVLYLGSWTGTSNASNLCGFPHTWTFHGPIKSMVYSSNRNDWTSCSVKNPYPLPSSLFLWQKSQLRLSTIWRRSLWWYLCPNCPYSLLFPGCPVTWWYHWKVGFIKSSGNSWLDYHLV